MSTRNLNLTERFIEGLKKYNLTLKDIQESNWRYCGGNKGRHLNYFRLKNPECALPEYKDHCVCGHEIVENCFITDGNQILVLGNCCIKKFVPKNARTCEICGRRHRNRIVDRCNECRRGLCDKCSGPCNPKYKTCYTCFIHF